MRDIQVLTKRDHLYLDMARKLARQSNEKKRHGCVVVNKKVVGIGFNKFRNDPYMVSPEHIKTDCSYHAEEMAIRQAGENTRGATLYVARINNVGLDRYSEPCHNCYQLIKSAGIKRVVFTDTGSYTP